MASIKNWAKFQHFKDRRPPWVKLYRDLLEDREWHKLDPMAAKMLVSLWLIASEDDGNLPDVETLAFRLRLSESDVSSCLSKLSHFLESADIKPISKRYQLASVADMPNSVAEVSVYLETETERETEKKSAAPPELPGFASFWQTWPQSERKAAKGKCYDAWKKAKCETIATLVLAHVERMKASQGWTKNGGEFIPAPLVYLNKQSWDGAEVVEQARGFV